MTMTREAFEERVQRFEAEARARPGAYRARVLLATLLGYGYLASVLLLLLALLLATLLSLVFLKALALKLIVPVAAFLWLVLKALWVRFDPPRGIRLTSADAPVLFEGLEQLRERFGAPRFHRVLLTDEFNAGVVQRPLLGPLGWHVNYLLVGLPLMKTLSPEQFEAVLAHEFGHLAGGHARVSNLVYRLRVSWSRLLAALEERDQFGSFLFRPFLRWYAPWFNALTFPLARANEYEADAAAAQLVSPTAAAEALTAVNVVGEYLERRFWPAIHRQADELPQPGFSPYAGLGESMAGELDDAAAHQWMKAAMEQRTTVDDTHPALADRLAGIGQKPRFAPPAPGAAADRLLGDSLPALAEALDRDWREAITPSWERRHREVTEGRAALAGFDRRVAAGETLSDEDAYRRALLTEDMGGDADAALEQLRALHARSPGHPLHCYALGVRLLDREDADGAALVERAIELDDEATEAGAEVLRDWHWRNGREDAAHAWHARLVERRELVAQAAAERENITTKDRFEPHALDRQAVDALVEAIAFVPGVRKVWLVRKVVEIFPDQPCHVLGFTCTPWWMPTLGGRVRRVQQAILDEVPLPPGCWVFCVEGDNARVGRRLQKVRRSRLL